MPEDWFFESLPLHPAPYPGECLSGYLLRLADLNGYSIFWDLVGDLFPSWGKPQQINKLKWEYPLNDWGRIPLRTGLTPGELTRLTIAPWVEKFRRPPDLNRSTYLSPGHFLRGLVNPVLRVCPLCLQSQPYLRLMWRLISVTTCLEHGCLLQDKFSACGSTLTPVSQDHLYLHCPTCGTDLRSLPVMKAPPDTLKAQRHKQDGFHFLLDPATALTQDNADAHHDPSRALGLKFHYLRDQAGISPKGMAKKASLTVDVITSLEYGALSPLEHYLSYLEALQFSWREFAALEVPDEFVQTLQTPRLMQLRLCPNPKCPNHLSPPDIRVLMLRDIPEQQIARFRCTTCGRRFTRSYDGALRVKGRHPRLHAGEPHILRKPQEEITTLIEMGTRGECNRTIAHRLGWGEKTIRIYWGALGLEEQVHTAQAKRRAEERLKRCLTLHSKIRVILDSLLEQNRKVTLRQISRALGTHSDYLHSHPEQAEYVRLMIKHHNIRIRQQRDDAVFAQITQSIENLQGCSHIVKIEEISSQAGLSYKQLCDHYPQLRLKIHEAIQAHRAWLRKVQIESQVQQIDAAARHLIDQGRYLNYHSILNTAGLSPYADKSAPIRDALIRWIGNFAPRD